MLISSSPLLLLLLQHHCVQETPRVYCQRNEWTELILLFLTRAGDLQRFWPGLLTLNGHMATALGR